MQSVGRHKSESNSLNSLTTIYSRLTTLGESEQVLNSIGISMKDMHGNVKNGADVLDEVAGKWSNLSKEQQYNTALQLAGQSQLSRFISLMENYDTSTRASEAALNSQGSAMQENADYMNSLEARIQTMKNAWDTLALSMGNAVINDSIIGVTSVLTGLMKVLTLSVDKLGLLPTLLGIVGTSAATVSKNFRTTTIAVLTLGKGMTSLGVSATTAKIAIRGLLASTGVGLALAALGFVIEKVINLFGNAGESQEEYFDSLKQNITDTEQEINSLEKLSDQLKDNTKSQDELNRLYEQTTWASSELIDHYTAEGDVVYKTKEQIDDLIKAKKEELLLNRQIALHEAKNVANESIKTINDNFEERDINQTKRNNLAAELEIMDYIDNFANENKLKGADITNVDFFEKKNEIEKAVNDLISGSGIDISKTTYLRNIMNNFTQSLIGNDISSLKTHLKDSIADLDSEINVSTQKINSSKRTLSENLSEIGSLYMETNGIDENSSNINLFNRNLANSFLETSDTVNKSGDQLKIEFEAINEKITAFLTQNQISLAEMIDSGNFDLLMKEIPGTEKLFEHLADQFSQSVQKKLPVYDALGKKIGEISGIADEAADNFYNLKAKLDDNGAVVGFTGSLGNLSGLLGYLSDHVSDAQNEIKLLEEAEDELNQTNQLSVGTLQKVVEKYGDRIDISNLTEEGIRNLIKSVKDDEAATLDSEIKKTEAIITNTQARINAMQAEVDAREALLDSLAPLVESGQMSDTEAERLYFNKTRNTASQSMLNEQKDALKEAENKLNAIIVARNSIYSYTSRSSGSKSNSKSKSSSTTSNKQHLDETQAIINGINKEIVAREKLNDAISKRAKELEEEKRYAGAIEKTNVLLASQNKEIEELNTANSKLKAERNKLQSNSKHDMSSWLDSSGQQSHAFIKLFNNSSESDQKVLQDRFDKWKLFSEAIAANEEKLDSLNDTIKETSNSQDSLKLSETKAYLEQQKNALADLNYEMDISEKTQAMFSEETKEYYEQTKIQNRLLQEKIKFLQDEVDWTTQKLTQGDLTNEQMEELNEYLKQNKLALLDAQKAARSLAETYADQSISNFKKMIEKKRDLELDALEERTKAENKRHNDYIKNMDDELKKFEEVINAQLKLLDRQNASEDYESELNKKLEERQEIIDEINKLSRDDSYEGIARKKDYEEKLAAKEEEISKFRLDRERELRKQNLNDQLEDKNRQTNTLKDIENDHHDLIIENLDDEKKKTEQKYKDILENEKYFYDLKQQLLSEDITVVNAALSEMTGMYQLFFDSIKLDAFRTSQEFQNLIYAIQQDFEKLSNLPIPSTNSNSKNESTYNVSPPLTHEQTIIEQMKANSREWAAATDKVTKDRLAAANLELAKKIPGATRDEKTGMWYKNNKLLYSYHTGGEVGVNGTSTKKWFEKLLMSDEVPAILKKGEVVLDKPISFINDVADRLRANIGSSFKLAAPIKSEAVGSGDVYMNIKIDRLTGDENGANKFFSIIQDNMKKKGR